LTLRNRALEAAVGDRVVLDVDRHALDRGIQAGTLGHGPALQRSVELEAEVVVQPRSRMLLDDEREALARRRHLAFRLGRHPEVAFLPIRRKRSRHEGWTKPGRSRFPGKTGWSRFSLLLQAALDEGDAFA